MRRPRPRPVRSSPLPTRHSSLRKNISAAERSDPARRSPTVRRSRRRPVPTECTGRILAPGKLGKAVGYVDARAGRPAPLRPLEQSVDAFVSGGAHVDTRYFRLLALPFSPLHAPRSGRPYRQTKNNVPRFTASGPFQPLLNAVRTGTLGFAFVATHWDYKDAPAIFRHCVSVHGDHAHAFMVDPDYNFDRKNRTQSNNLQFNFAIPLHRPEMPFQFSGVGYAMAHVAKKSMRYSEAIRGDRLVQPRGR